MLNKEELLSKQNEDLRKEITSLKTPAAIRNVPGGLPPDTGGLLNQLISTVEKNRKKKKQGYRCDENTKKFASHIFISGGREQYETMCGNLRGSLPIVMTVARTIQSTWPPVREGEFRFKELTLLHDGIPLKYGLLKMEPEFCHGTAREKQYLG